MKQDAVENPHVQAQEEKMTLSELRTELQVARERLIAGDTATAISQIDQVLGELAADRLVTTEEAAELLGVRSDYVVKLWCRHGNLNCVMAGDRWLVPLAEIEEFALSEQVRNVRIADQYLDATKELGRPEGLTEDELADLSASRPGRWPWQT